MEIDFKEIEKLDSRAAFNDTFLYEMPQGTQATDLSVQLIYEIQELINEGIKKTKIKPGFYRIELENQVYYWYEKNGKILLGSQYEINT